MTFNQRIYRKNILNPQFRARVRFIWFLLWVLNKICRKGIVQNVLRRLEQVHVKQNQEEQKNKAGLKRME